MEEKKAWISVAEAAKRSDTTVQNIQLALRRGVFETRIEYRKGSPKGEWRIELDSFNQWRQRAANAKKRKKESADEGMNQTNNTRGRQTVLTA